MKVPLARPALGEAERDAVAEVLASGWLASGPRVARFEALIADRVGARHAVATSSGTAALHVALLLLGVGPGDEVVVPSYTWVATANAVAMTGARPVFADVDLTTFGLTAAAVEAVLSARTRAVVPVHQFGFPCELTAIASLAGSRGLALVEDAACALGSRCQGRPIGGHGNTACFSFHPRKLVTTGEGGAVTLDDASLAERARRLINHGHSPRPGADAGGFAEHGFNYRMSDLHAAVGGPQMERLDDLLAARRRVAGRYAEALGGAPDLVLPGAAPGDEPNWQSYPVRLVGAGPARRDRVAARLRESGIGCRAGYVACHLEPVYRKLYPGVSLPRTETALATVLLLPMHSGLGDDEQDHVVTTLLDALDAR